MNNLSQFIEKINNINYLLDENMKSWSTFKTGGNADIMLFPSNVDEIVQILKALNGHDYFILGSGANILVSDNGIKCPVINLKDMNNITLIDNTVSCGAGVMIDNLCEFALENSMTGLEFLYGLPSSIGGAVYMNARCYDYSICEKLDTVTYIDSANNIINYKVNQNDFSYKKSPFQTDDKIIINATFKLESGIKDSIKNNMNEKKDDRKNKGHYNFPCAGSVFKNNRAFGAPSGKIIDDQKLRGYSIGGAKISDYHANIIINQGDAKSSEIKELIDFVKERVYSETSFKLEEEVIYVGSW